MWVWCSLQIYLGALVAGLRAGLIYNTWPLIDGHLIPSARDLLFNEPWWRNFFENPLTVQFDHRMVAYAVLARRDAPCGRCDADSAADAARRGALALAGAVMLQAALGIVTLLVQAPLSLALMHQAMAMVVLTIAVLHRAGRGRDRTASVIRRH